MKPITPEELQTLMTRGELLDEPRETTFRRMLYTIGMAQQAERIRKLHEPCDKCKHEAKP